MPVAQRFRSPRPTTLAPGNRVRARATDAPYRQKLLERQRWRSGPGYRSTGSHRAALAHWLAVSGL
jgi:hypothetical protein